MGKMARGGMAPQLKKWLEKYNMVMAAWLAKGFVPTPGIARDGLATLTRSMVTDIPAIAVVMDEVAGPEGQVSVRIYHPEPELALPVLIYLHGGGHMAGSVAVYDPICRKIAMASRRVVVAVDYRLAPEHPYPAGIDDARAVVAGYAELLGGHRLNHGAGLALAGDSAGGAMSATLVHTMPADERLKINQLILIYPGLDYTLSQPSVNELATGYLLDKERIFWYFDHYFKKGDDRKAASPLFMPVPRGGFPRTMIITAGFCPLRDEAILYLAKLQQCGVAVRHLHFDDMLHAFLNLENVASESCRRAYQAIAGFLDDRPTPIVW